MVRPLDQLATGIVKGFRGKLYPGTIRHYIPRQVLDDRGDSVDGTSFFNEYNFEGIAQQYSLFYRAQAQIPDTDLNVLIIIKGYMPVQGDFVKIQGQWFQVRKVISDVVTTTFNCQSFLVKNPPDDYAPDAN